MANDVSNPQGEEEEPLPLTPSPPHSSHNPQHTPSPPLSLLTLLTIHEPAARCVYTHLRSIDLYSLSLTSRSFHTLLSSSIGPWRNLDLSDVRCLQLPTRSVDLIPTALRGLLPGWTVKLHIPKFIKNRLIDDVSKLTSLVVDGTDIRRETLVWIAKNARSLRHISVRWCMAISLRAVEDVLDVVAVGNDGRGLKSFWIFGISAIPAFILAASAHELTTTLSRFSKQKISTDIFLCPSCSTSGYVSIAICDDDEEAVCHTCKISIRTPISCLLCFRKGSCEHCGRFYCENCRDDAYRARAKYRRSTPSLVEERGEGMEKVVLGQDTLIDAVCTSNNYTRYHPWYTLPHRLCPDCVSYYGRCQKYNCGKLFCPLTKLAASLRETNSHNNNNNTASEGTGEITTSDIRYTRHKSRNEIRTEKHFEKTDAVSCTICKRKCCKSCWIEEKYCRVCTTPGKTAIFKNRAAAGTARKSFCNGCGTFGLACICPPYVCYKCRDEQLEKDGTKWRWFRCQNCRWEGDESHGREGLRAGSVPAIFGNVGR